MLDKLDYTMLSICLLTIAYLIYVMNRDKLSIRDVLDFYLEGFFEVMDNDN